MRRILMVLSLSALLVSAMAVPAFADKGGLPNEKNDNKACHGQTIRGNATENGLTPPEHAELLEQAFPELEIENAGDLSKLIKTQPVLFDCASPV
jgi:hypothetical protein